MIKKILLAGESWMSYTTHIKGFDAFYTSVYETGEKWIKVALENGGFEVDFLPNHLAGEKFPFDLDKLNEYSCVILSDIGSNTLLIPAETFSRSIPKPNRIKLIQNYVLEAAGLLSDIGVLTFSGLNLQEGMVGADPPFRMTTG